MHWETLYCPNPFCRSSGRPFRQGLFVKNGTTPGQKQALCRAWGRSIAVNHATAYFELDSDPLIFETTTRALAEGVSLRSAARIIQIDKDTACAALQRAAQHCRLVMLHLWQNLPVAECQLDELWSFVPTKEQHLPTA